VTGTRFSDVLHPEIAAEAAVAAPLRRLPDATDIAETVAFLVSDRARAITGETVNVSAGAFMRY
jgi:enoyl-[acyl-carrier-protein] reductase (NADH)